MTNPRMRSLLLALLVALVTSAPKLAAAQAGFQTGRLVGIEKKIQITPLSYLWNTVVTYSETVTYELRIEVGSETYTTDYTPIIQPSFLPVEWRVGAPIDVRIANRKMLLKSSYGDLESYIVRHKAN
jgi:hypothetical protein